MMTSKTSSKKTKIQTTNDKSTLTRSFSLTHELDDELMAFSDRLKRTRSSIIVEALGNFFLNNAPKDQ